MVEEGWEMIPLKGSEECKVVLWVKALHSGICSAYEMFAQQESANEVRWAAACPPIDISVVCAVWVFRFGFQLSEVFGMTFHL